MDWRLELVAVPVTGVDRARDFYTDRVGFTLDHDHRVHDELRFVQLTPVGSACSIVIGTGITTSPPGSAQLQVVVGDADAAREELAARGVGVSEVDEQPWGRFVYFSDPDGNRWACSRSSRRHEPRSGGHPRVLPRPPSGVGASNLADGCRGWRPTFVRADARLVKTARRWTTPASPIPSTSSPRCSNSPTPTRTRCAPIAAPPA